MKVDCSNLFYKFLVSILPQYFTCKDAPVSTTTTTTNPPTSTTTTTTSATSYVYVDGDLRDKGGEVWNANFNGMDVRLSANDSQHLHNAGIPCKGSWYPLNGDVVKGTVTLKVSADGGIYAEAQDAKSSITGKLYHCVGYFVQSDSLPLVKQNPITIAKADCKKTLRIAYATVAKV